MAHNADEQVVMVKEIFLCLLIVEKSLSALPLIGPGHMFTLGRSTFGQ